MSFNHPVSDLVAIIKNGYLAQKTSIMSPFSKIRENILKVLKEEGYISNYVKIKFNNHDYFNISLKYYNNKPVLSEINIISKPGRKIYCSADKIPLIKNGLGMCLISTSHGILSDHIARTKNLGGEILLKIF
jgi:small subunit ribosomal protein S8